jgi:hypothetical protein
LQNFTNINTYRRKKVNSTIERSAQEVSNALFIIFWNFLGGYRYNFSNVFIYTAVQKKIQFVHFINVVQSVQLIIKGEPRATFGGIAGVLGHLQPLQLWPLNLMITFRGNDKITR